MVLRRWRRRQARTGLRKGGRVSCRQPTAPEAGIAMLMRRRAHPDTVGPDRGRSASAARRPAGSCGFSKISSSGHLLRTGTVRTRVSGRCLFYRDERFPTGACDANRSRTARSSPQGAGAKGWEANVRPKEHKWAVRQDVGGEQASTREAQESLTAFCRAQRRERKEQTLTRGDPGAERHRGVSRGHSSV